MRDGSIEENEVGEGAVLWLLKLLVIALLDALAVFVEEREVVVVSVGNKFSSTPCVVPKSNKNPKYNNLRILICLRLSLNPRKRIY